MFGLKILFKIHKNFTLNRELVFGNKKDKRVRNHRGRFAVNQTNITMRYLLSIITILTLAFSSSVLAQDKVEITIEGNDKMQFNLNEIKVEAGQTVVLTLKHVGKLPKAAMGHNWVLLTQGTEINKFGAAASKFAGNDYIPEDTDQVIAHTELVGGGQQTTIEFKAPEKGTYDFICSFPGHYAMMKGKFIVE